jgi:hypothetical protein
MKANENCGVAARGIEQQHHHHHHPKTITAIS